MEKRTKILIIIISISAVVSVLLFFFIKTKSKPSPQANPEPSRLNEFSIPAKDAPRMTFSTPLGEITTNNVYHNPLENLSQNGVTFKEGSDYSMSFYPNDKAFLVVIKNPDTETARDKAEKDLLQTLDINEDTACKLTVVITVPYAVNSSLSGKEYGLSFCPGAKTF